MRCQQSPSRVVWRCSFHLHILLQSLPAEYPFSLTCNSPEKRERENSNQVSRAAPPPAAPGSPTRIQDAALQTRIPLDHPQKHRHVTSQTQPKKLDILSLLFQFAQMSFSSSQMPHTSPSSSSLPPPLPPGTPNNNTPPPPQPPTTPRTLHSEDPEVATPHEGPYPSHQHHETDKPVASPTTSSSPPPPPVPSLRADWLAARAPEYYQRAPPADGPEVYYYSDGERGRAAGEGKERERVCGLRPVVFWIMVILLVLVLGGAIGGGVGGGLAAAAAAKERYVRFLFHLAASRLWDLWSFDNVVSRGR